MNLTAFKCALTLTSNARPRCFMPILCLRRAISSKSTLPTLAELLEGLTEADRSRIESLNAIHSLWGRTHEISERTVPLPTDCLRATKGRLFLFTEYRYITSRVNNYRASDPGVRKAVVILGSPGIG